MFVCVLDVFVFFYNCDDLFCFDILRIIINILSSNTTKMYFTPVKMSLEPHHAANMPSSLMGGVTGGIGFAYHNFFKNYQLRFSPTVMFVSCFLIMLRLSTRL